MKKIIISRNIMQEIGGNETLFGRGTITTYPARTSEEILSIQEVRRADLIITESTLPLMGGVKLCAAIRGNPGLKNVSIIMTCDGTEESRAQCREAQANAVITKPIDVIQLFSKVSELIMIPQRKELRMPLRATVQGDAENKPFTGISHNISISGMLIETNRMLKVGERFTGTVAVGQRELVIDCEVMRVVPSAGRYRLGVKFLNPDTKSLIIIEQLVKGGIKR